ncbi:hypothetical protein [Rhodococcus koreensis]|uniref:hypothetical protein n=1 Tax=Rhodococcus koreensis TaxID=99653 RepID=UPI00366E57B6
MSKGHPAEQRECDVKMGLDHQGEHPSIFAACVIAPKLGVGVESLRTWTRRALVPLNERADPHRVFRPVNAS